MKLLRELDIVPELLDARSIEDVAELALKDLKNLPQPIAMVCGRLSTGGGRFEENRRVIRKAISFLRRRTTVFDQLIFLGRIDRLPGARWKLRIPLLRHYFMWRRRRIIQEKLHLSILKSGFIKEIYFLPGWERSRESRWYHGRAEELGIKIRYLKEKDFSAR